MCERVVRSSSAACVSDASPSCLLLQYCASRVDRGTAGATVISASLLPGKPTHDDRRIRPKDTLIFSLSIYHSYCCYYCIYVYVLF